MKSKSAKEKKNATVIPQRLSFLAFNISCHTSHEINPTEKKQRMDGDHYKKGFISKKDIFYFKEAIQLYPDGTLEKKSHLCIIIFQQLNRWYLFICTVCQQLVQSAAVCPTLITTPSLHGRRPVGWVNSETLWETALPGALTLLFYNISLFKEADGIARPWLFSPVLEQGAPRLPAPSQRQATALQCWREAGNIFRANAKSSCLLKCPISLLFVFLEILGRCLLIPSCPSEVTLQLMPLRTYNLCPKRIKKKGWQYIITTTATLTWLLEWFAWG